MTRILLSDLTEASLETDDPLWRLPLYMGYDKDIRAKFADITNAPAGGMAGAITAALFLKRFVTKTTSWAHFDIYGWAHPNGRIRRRGARRRRSARSTRCWRSK